MTAALVFAGDATIIAGNLAAGKLLGSPERALVGRSLADLGLQLVDMTGAVKSIEGFPANRVVAGHREVEQLDFGLRLAASGTVLWLRAGLQPEFDADGEPVSLLMTLINITDLVGDRHIHNQIVLAKREWEATVDALQDVVSIQDKEWRIIRANKAAHEMFGYQLGELKGKRCFEVYHQRSTPCAECPAPQAGTSGHSHTQIVYNRIVDKTFSVSSFPVFDLDGQMHLFVHVARDVTKSLQNESEMKRLMAAIEQTSESVVIAGRDGEIQYVNPAFEMVSGYSRTEVIGKKPSILKSGLHDRQFYASMWSTLLNKQVWRGRLTNRHKNGCLFKEDVTISPVLDTSGRISNFVALKRDVTREELLEQQLHQAMKMEALGTLAGGIAHDFNNILASIIGYGEMAKERLPTDHPARKSLDQVLAGGDRAVDLVRQILTFSRKESYSQFRPVRLQQVIGEVIRLLRPSLPATIELRHEIEPSCPAILGDHGQLYQVLMNLCTNASQSIGENHGRITISLAGTKSPIEPAAGRAPSEGQETLVALEVRDTGCGIEPEHLGKIFDPFFTTRKKQQGTGLGLAVVHGIIRKHKGEIQVSSRVGEGTTVQVYFAGTGEPLAARKVSKVGPAGGNERIMVIDDEPALAELLRIFLNKAGYRVSTFHDSIAAVKQFRKDPHCCDLVITDMLMPDMTGAELAREFLGQRPDMPIVILTGHSENFDRQRAKQLGVRELLLKPVKKENLYQIVRKVLEDGKNLDH